MWDIVKVILLLVGLIALLVFCVVDSKQLKSDCRNGDQAACAEYIIRGRFY